MRLKFPVKVSGICDSPSASRNVLSWTVWSPGSFSLCQDRNVISCHTYVSRTKTAFLSWGNEKNTPS